jgi:hypothetical protein
VGVFESNDGMQFLHDVALADLVMPGRRIDVPAETLRRSRPKNVNEQLALVAN